MRYKCLVIDHDDTVVKSTETIHYPCFLSFMKMQGRDMSASVTLEDYFTKNFFGDIRSFYLDYIGLTEELLNEETMFWRDCVNNCVPNAYYGLCEILTHFRELGGKIYVASHSESCFILRDWSMGGLPTPDGVYGYDAAPDMRKPSSRIIDDIIKATGLEKSEILVVDDLKLGYDMAKLAGVDFAAALWAHSIPAIDDFMKNNCKVILKSTDDLSRLLFK